MKLLFIGPFPPPITGHAAANQMAFDGLCKKSFTICKINTENSAKIEDISSQGKFRAKKFISIIFNLFFDCSKIFFGKFDSAYLTPGQTFFGFMRFCFYMICCKVKKTPYILHFHGGYFRSMFDSLRPTQQAVLRFFLQKSAGVIVLGESLKFMFEGIVPDDKIYICKNGVHPDFILSKAEIREKIERQKCKGNIRLLYLSNIIESKGVLFFLDALLLMKKNKIDFFCDIAGAMDAHISTSFLERVSFLGNSVMYHGVVKGKEKRALLKEADCLCLPTFYPVEGQPICILEAYGAGCSVVCTDHAGILDIFEEGKNGFLCQKKNVESIVDSILKIKQSIHSFTKNNHDLCLSSYSQENFVRNLIAIISVKKSGI